MSKNGNMCSGHIWGAIGRKQVSFPEEKYINTIIIIKSFSFLPHWQMGSWVNRLSPAQKKGLTHIVRTPSLVALASVALRSVH